MGSINHTHEINLHANLSVHIFMKFNVDWFQNSFAVVQHLLISIIAIILGFKKRTKFPDN